jgi:hypothetical protein
MKAALVLPLLLALACAQPSAVPVTVKVPVPVPCPPPQIPARPQLPSAQLAQGPTLQDLVKALLADREALAAWALDLERRLKAYLPADPSKDPR